MMQLHRTREGLFVKTDDDRLYALTGTELSELLGQDSPVKAIQRMIDQDIAVEVDRLLEDASLTPIDRQEVWAAGVTYRRSRNARMEESAEGGGDDFYDRVYDAARPELFFKSMPHRVVGHRQAVRVRSDSRWSVPEPELALVINTLGSIVGYTIGNDMSARDIEGENPLYLPQAKIYDGACAIGPCLLLSDEPLPASTNITLHIERDGRPCVEDTTRLDQMKRSWTELVDYLYKEQSFPFGCLLMTGTGIVPPDDFTLKPGDTISITIEPIGTLINRVEV